MASQKKSRKAIAILVLLIIIIAVVIILMLTPMMKKYSPSKDPADYASYYGLDSDDAMFVVVNNQRSEINGMYIDGQAYVDYDTVHDKINSRFYWDPEEEILRYTLPDALVSVKGDSAE